MGMVCGLIAVDEDQINEFLADPENFIEFSEEECESVDEREAAGTSVYLDKAWNGIHFLLTGTEWDGDEPWCYLLKGGEEIGVEDYNLVPPRALRPKQVADWAEALSTISIDELQKRFDPERMMRANIYPNIWDREVEGQGNLEYLLVYYTTTSVLF